MSNITNKKQKGFKGITEYRKAYADLVKEQTDFAWKNVQALEYTRANFDLAVTASMQGFARKLRDLDAEWINSNIVLEEVEPLAKEAAEEKRDHRGADMYDTQRDLHIELHEII